MGYLIFSAALALALFGAGVAAQWTARRNNDEVLQRVEVLAREGRVEDALGVAHAQQGASAEVLIAGCTEVPMVLAPEDVRLELVDPGDLLARKSVAVCLGWESLPQVHVG